VNHEVRNTLSTAAASAGIAKKQILIMEAANSRTESVFE